MTSEPLISAALLGTARSPVLPAAPDAALEEIWHAIPRENPAAALLQALALTRSLHRAGAKPQSVPDANGRSPCPPESRELLPAAAIDFARRLLAGEFPELLREWIHHATATGKILPARALPEFLAAATQSPALRDAVPQLVGERGFWIARRHSQFSWLLESSSSVEETDWTDGPPAARLAWLRQTRAANPDYAATLIASHWPDQDAAMRESMVSHVADQPHPCDEAWLESLALKDRRQEIRDSAARALMALPDSAYLRRALDRARQFVGIKRQFFKSSIHIEEPAVFDPTWADDGIKAKPPQGTGE